MILGQHSRLLLHLVELDLDSPIAGIEDGMCVYPAPSFHGLVERLGTVEDRSQLRSLVGSLVEEVVQGKGDG